MFLKDQSIQTLKNLLIRTPKRILRFFEIFFELYSFNKTKDNRFSVRLADIYPCTGDRLKTTPYDAHYLYHPAWAARILKKTSPSHHVDISSILYFGTMVSAFLPVSFYDYRPAKIKLNGYKSEYADLLNLPFENNSVESLSCMHTIEHIGLGRYGDPIDPTGDIKAMKELQRVLKPGGTLIIVTPVGIPKIEFNAHRIYSFEHITGAFNELHLNEFAIIKDDGDFIENADPKMISTQKYACGCFWFQK